jgi:hypothetical protein
MHVTLTARRGDRPMRNAGTWLFLSLDVSAEQPDEFVTEVDEATGENVRSVLR